MQIFFYLFFLYFNISAKVPFYSFYITINIFLNHFTMLPTIFPFTFRIRTILIKEFAHSIHLIMLKLTFILISILPKKSSISCHLIMQPLALVCLFLIPIILTFSLQLIIYKLSLIITSILEEEFSISILFAFTP